MAEIALQGHPVHTIGDMPKVGDAAPDFVLVNQALENRSLKDFAGEKKLLYVFPSLDTSVCAESIKKYNEHAKAHPGNAILLISSDLPFAQKRFCVSERIESIVTLSSMRSQAFGNDYGLLITDGSLAGILARAQMVLDENNKVLYSYLVPEISQEPDYEAALQHLS